MGYAFPDGEKLSKYIKKNGMPESSLEWDAASGKMAVKNPTDLVIGVGATNKEQIHAAQNNDLKLKAGVIR